MGRPLFILLTVWAMVAAPMLCSGGVLEYHCHDRADAEHEDHESGCSIDPCNQDTIRQNDDESSLTIHKPLPLAAPLAVLNHCDALCFGEPAVVCDESPPGLNLQYHPSDRPLLN